MTLRELVEETFQRLSLSVFYSSWVLLKEPRTGAVRESIWIMWLNTVIVDTNNSFCHKREHGGIINGAGSSEILLHRTLILLVLADLRHFLEVIIKSIPSGALPSRSTCICPPRLLLTKVSKSVWTFMRILFSVLCPWKTLFPPPQISTLTVLS